MLKTSDLAVGYGERKIVSGISLQMRSEESLLVLGGNGAGKTTLLRTLFGFIPPIAGSVSLLGRKVGSSQPSDLIRAGARYLGQGERSFPELRIRASRNVMNRLHGIPGRGASSQSLRRVAHLSAGQRRLEALELVAAGSPSLYVLDEPLAGLDPAHRQRVQEWVLQERRRGASFVIVEQAYDEFLHSFELALVLRNGLVSFSGAAEELENSAKLSEVLFG